MPDLKYLQILHQKHVNEQTLIASGAISNYLYKSLFPVSAVEIAGDLDISIPLVEKALLELETDLLALRTYEGDWISSLEVEF